jgi:hypothetical protein
VKRIEEEAGQVNEEKARPRKNIGAKICIVVGMEPVIVDIEQPQAGGKDKN